jgi:D-psicose/D-tagatose/L-ribulose 3-epimerase
MFKFGVSSFIWSENFTKDDIHLIEKAKSFGFDLIDIGIFDPEDFPVKEVAKELKSVGIEVVTITPLPANANLISPEKNIRKNGVKILKKLIDINAAIGSKILGGINYAAAGYLTGRPRTQDEWSWSVESMREVCSYAESTSDVIIALECVNRFETHFLNIADDAVRYCKDVGTDNVKVHLDSYHMIREEQSFKDAVEVCGKDYLEYVHVCENNRGIPGTGLVPWNEFFTALKKIGYGGPLVIEAFDPGFEELNRLSATWRKFAATGEELAVKGLKNLKKIEKEL